MHIEGEFKNSMGLDEAISYLTAHEHGVIGHNAMEDASFIFMRDDGVMLFYNSEKDDVEPITEEDVASFANEDEWSGDWYYRPGSDMAQTIGGMEFFDDIRRAPTGLLPLK